MRTERDDTEENDDIAPVMRNVSAPVSMPSDETKKKDSGLDFFQSPTLFDDGYQAGDIAKTILGTVGDVAVNVVKGAQRVGEGLIDLGAYGVAEIAKSAGNEKWAKRLKETAAKSQTDFMWGGTSDFLDDYSVLGRTTDSATEALGQVGLIMLTGGAAGAAGAGTIGTTALTTGVMGASGMGSGMSEAYQGGATDEEAVTYGVISGGADALTELLFGGLGKAVGAVGLSKGLSSADDLLAKKVSTMFKSQIAKNIAEFGVKASAEGLEEVIAGTAQAIGKYKTYMSEEEFDDILRDENLLEQFVVGAVTSGIAQSGVVPGMKSGSLAEANKTGRDFITGYTQNEQAVIDKEVEKRIAEREQGGTKLTNKQKGEIEKQVQQELDEGGIDIDTIEETLGGETYKTYKDTVDSEDAQIKELENQIKELEDAPNTVGNAKKFDALTAQLEDLKTNSQRDQLKTQLSDEVYGIAKDTRLVESYNEKSRRGQAFEADVTQYDEKQRATIQSAIDSGILNNTTKTHKFVDFIARVSADKGVSFNFADNAKIKETGFAVEGATVNGYVTENGDITLNINSAKSLNSVVGHEVTHILEGTDLYNQLQESLFKYAEGKGEYQTRLDALTKLYEGKQGYEADFDTKVKAELTADLVGDYLFTDADFIHNLSTSNRTVFEKIYDEIKYLYKVATAGSQEARELEKVKKLFEDAYRGETKNTAKDGGVRRSLSETTDGRIAAVVDNDILSNIDISVWDKATKEKAQKAATNALKQFKDGIVVDGITRKVNRTSRREYTRSKDTETLYRKTPDVFADKMRAADIADDIVVATTNWSRDGGLKHPRNDNFVDFDHGTVLIVSGDAKYIAEVVVGITNAGDAVFYDVVDLTPTSFEIKNAESPTTATTQNAVGDIQGDSAEDNVPQKGENVKRQYSLTDNTGRELSPAVQTRFANSKVVDENGYLKVVYHGTATGEFSIFDKAKGNVEGDYGSGFYFTDNEADVEEHYEGGGPDFDNKVGRRADEIWNEEDGIEYEEAERRAREEMYKGSHKFEVYLNVENPAIVGETILLDSESYYSEYSEEDYDSYDDYRADVDQLIADDIDNIIWEIEKNVDVYSTDGISTVLYDAVYNGGIGLEELKKNLNDLYLEDSNGNLVANEVARQIIESLGYDGIIDPTVSTKWNMDMESGTTHYIVFKPNQIKSVTNANPTDNPDIHLSISAKGKAQKTHGNYNVYGKDVALAPVQDSVQDSVQDVAPVAENAKTAFNAPLRYDIDHSPAAEADVTAMAEESFASVDDADAPPETEAPYYGESQPNTAADPMADRDWQSVGDRKVKAFTYENPEAKPFFQMEANAMLGELMQTTKGERHYNDELYYATGGEQGWYGTKRFTSDEIAYLLDGGLSYAQIENGLNAIIEGNGAENNAASKRIEMMINDRLLNGYTDFMTGEHIPPNQGYIEWVNGRQSEAEYAESAAAITDADAPMFDAPIAPVATTAAQTAVAEDLTEDVAPTTGKAKQRKWVGTSTESEAVNREILPDDLDQNAIHYQPIPNKVTLGNANARLDSMGYDMALTYFNSQMAGKKITLDDIALGERLIQEAIKKGDKKTAGELIQNVSILGTELGQKVQALSIIKKLTPEGQLKMLQKVVERGKAKGDKAYDGVEVNQDMVDNILGAYAEDGTYDQDKLNAAVEDAKQKLADQMKVGVMDKVNSWRYLSMLGNPKTHIRNVFSNIAMMGTVEVKNAIARTVEGIAPIETRTKTWRRASEDVKAFAKKTTLEMKDVLQDGGKYSEDASIKEKRKIFKSKLLNWLADGNSDLLSREDWAFSKPAFRRSLQEYLTANGIVTEQDILLNPEIVEKARQYATEQSQIATFRQYSWLANKISEMERHNAVTDIAVGAILPFKKTPINIAKAGLSYSPLGLAKSLTYDAVQVKKGNMEASTLIDHLAQGLTGTGLTLLGYMLASMGTISGGGDDDKEGKYDYQLGEQSYAVNIGGKSYSLSWLSPVAMPLFVGANAYETLVEKEEWDGDVVVQTLAETLDPLSEMSFLSGLDSVLSSYESGVGKFLGIGEAMTQNYATQFIPTLFSQVATVTDDTKRSTKASKDSGWRAGEETWNKIKFKFPVLRQTLEPSTDIWGNDIKQTENKAQLALETFIAPYAVRENTATAIDEEIKGLYRETGDNGLLPSVPYNYLNYKDEKYDMSAEDFTAYKKTYGKTAYDMLAGLFDTNTYRTADSATKAELVNKVYDYARDEANREYLKKQGVTYTNATEDKRPVYKENAIKGAIRYDVTPDEYTFMTEYPEKHSFFKENGITYETYKNADEDGKRAYSWAYENQGKYTMSKAISDDFLTFYKYKSDLNEIRADKDEYGESISGSSKEKKLEYINNLDLDYGQKIILFRSLYDGKADKEAYNLAIVNYLNGRDDISYEEMETILEELDMTVAEDGRIYW